MSLYVDLVVTLQSFYFLYSPTRKFRDYAIANREIQSLMFTEKDTDIHLLSGQRRDSKKELTKMCNL